MITIEELAATVGALASRVAALEVRVPPGPRAGPLQLADHDGAATVTEFLDRVPALPADLDQLFENTLAAHPEVLPRAGIAPQELRRDFETALRYVQSRAQLAVVDKKLNLRDWLIIVEDWHLSRHESNWITGPALLLAALAAGVPIEVGRDVWSTHLALSEKPRRTAPVQRSAAA